MKQNFCNFFTRGLLSAWGGPAVLAVVYLILGLSGVVQELDPIKLATQIFTVTLLAFLCGGVTVIYQSERLPLIFRGIVHSAVLYAAYAAFYLLNGLLPRGAFWGFTAIFFLGFALIWLVVYLCVRKKTDKLNSKIR